MTDPNLRVNNNNISVPMISSSKMDENNQSLHHGKRNRTKEMYDIVVDYSGYSTLAGLIYVFMPGQPYIGKVITSFYFKNSDQAKVFMDIIVILSFIYIFAINFLTCRF